MKTFDEAVVAMKRDLEYWERNRELAIEVRANREINVFFNVLLKQDDVNTETKIFQAFTMGIGIGIEMEKP